jgi:pimeloyl-ACP methyl ester carboxylesterase
MGGYIALEIASQFPERVQKVVMLHSTFVADTEEKKINRDRTADLLAKKGTSFFIGPFLSNLFANPSQELVSTLASRYRELSAAGLIAATRPCGIEKILPRLFKLPISPFYLSWVNMTP